MLTTILAKLSMLFAMSLLTILRQLAQLCYAISQAVSR